MRTYLLEQVCTCMCVHMARYCRENCPKEGRDCSGQLCLAVFVVLLVGPDTPDMVEAELGCLQNNLFFSVK